MVAKVVTLPAAATVLDACEFFIQHRLLAFPVVDADGRLLGVVDIDLYTNELAHLDRATPVGRLVEPLVRFLHVESSGGIVLLACTVVALVLANSPLEADLRVARQTVAGVAVGNFSLTEPLLLWINDGLMALFFLVVGLEIKREIVSGELADPRKALLPVVAAVGGMVVPAALYAAGIGAGRGARLGRADGDRHRLRRRLPDPARPARPARAEDTAPDPGHRRRHRRRPGHRGRLQQRHPPPAPRPGRRAGSA